MLLLVLCFLAGLTRGLGMTLLRDTPSYGVYFCVYHFAVQGLGLLMYPAADPRQQQQEQEEAHTTQQRLVHTEQQQSAHAEQPLVVQANSVWEGAEQPVHRLSLVQQPPQLMQQQQQEAHLEQEPQQQQQEQRQQPQKQVNPGASQPLVQFIAGGLAGAIAWMSIYPIDVIKCRMQVCVWVYPWQCCRKGGGARVVGFVGAGVRNPCVSTAAATAANAQCCKGPPLADFETRLTN